MKEIEIREQLERKQAVYLNINDYSFKLKGLITKLKNLKLELKYLQDTLSDYSGFERVGQNWKIRELEAKHGKLITQLCFFLGLDKVKTGKISYSVSEAKEQQLIPSREDFLNSHAYYDLVTGELTDRLSADGVVIENADKTYKEVIEASDDSEKYTKLFNKLYNNTLSSTGPYTMDMFVYERDVVFKARKRIQVVSTFPIGKVPSASYPPTYVAQDSSDFNRYFQYKRLENLTGNLHKYTVLEYMFRKMFKSPCLGTQSWVKAMDSLSSIIEQSSESSLRGLFENRVLKKTKESTTVETWLKSLKELYIQDIVDEEFRSYIENWILNCDEVTDEEKKMFLGKYLDKKKVIPTKVGGNKAQIKTFSKSSQNKLLFTLTNANARWKSMITLTYPKVFPKDGLKAKRHLNTFLVSMKHHLNKSNDTFKYFWWMEFQDRGAMHYHIYVETLKDEIENSPLRKVWNEIAGKSFTAHEVYGFQVKDLSKVSHSYIVDYAVSYAKSRAGFLNENSDIMLVDKPTKKKNSSKHSQKLVPDTIYRPGRFWGASWKLAQFHTVLIDVKCTFAGVIKRLKEAGFRNFHLPFYIHKINIFNLENADIIEKDEETTQLNFSYKKTDDFYQVQGKNSYIPSLNWTSKQEIRDSLIKGIINATIEKKKKTKLLDPTINISLAKAYKAITEEINVMTCDIFLLFAYWRVFQRYWHFFKMNPTPDFQVL